jgi:hypothetical protein
VTRIRPRRYRNIDVVNHGRHEHLRARAKVALLKGQRFGRASAGRRLNADEIADVERRLKQEGSIP